jgi:hypothetical protein
MSLEFRSLLPYPDSYRARARISKKGYEDGIATNEAIVRASSGSFFTRTPLALAN